MRQRGKASPSLRQATTLAIDVCLRVESAIFMHVWISVLHRFLVTMPDSGRA
jgi:hypothetical protein